MRVLCPRVWTGFAVALFLLVEPVAAQSIDGGRGDLPGMKQDIFDQVQKNKKTGSQQRRKAAPECPKSDLMSPFYSLAFANGEIYVRLNSTDGPCQRLISVGGANYSELKNASRTCGPAGEWKNRIAENMSSMFFQGGYESWVKHSNDTIEVITEEGTFTVEVNEEKYAEQLACWRYACGCEQANNPIMRGIGLAVLVVAIGIIGFDGIKLLFQKGKKPQKHVTCKKGHRMEEGKVARTHYCDVCHLSGTQYQCSSSCNYDMCKKCYKEEKKKLKAAMKEWLDKHPEEKEKAKKEKDKDDSDDETKKDKSGDDASGADKSEAESTRDDPDEKKDTDKSETSEPESAKVPSECVTDEAKECEAKTEEEKKDE